MTKQESTLASDIARCFDTKKALTYEEIAQRLDMNKGPLLYEMCRTLEEARIIQSVEYKRKKLFITTGNVGSLPITTQEVWIIGTLRGDL